MVLLGLYIVGVLIHDPGLVSSGVFFSEVLTFKQFIQEIDIHQKWWFILLKRIQKFFIGHFYSNVILH